MAIARKTEMPDTRFKVYMSEVNDRDRSSTMNRLIMAQPYYIYV